MAAGHGSNRKNLTFLKEKLTLLIPPELVKDPVVHNIGHKFGLITNILHAEVKDGFGGIMVLEIEGELVNMDKAKDFLVSRKIKVL